MRWTLVASRLPGTLPILYVFLARSGKAIKDVSLVRIDQDGTAQVDDGVVGTDAKSPRGVKIDFVEENGQPQTLYYFSVNVDNDEFKASSFMRFCERLGTGDAFVKSASYLMHRDQFSEVRDFLLAHSRLILQDDFGIPVTRFDQARWQLRPFGHYFGPISLFANRYQSRLAQLFDRSRAEPIEFGVGYRWRSQTSNLMLAVKADAANDGAGAGAQPAQASGEVPIGENTSDVNRTIERRAETTLEHIKLPVAAGFTRSPNIPPEPSGSPEHAFEHEYYRPTTALLFGFDLGIDRRLARLECCHTPLGR
jgi:hypothetical protein